jgi:flavin reductase (DIM6/NTAB) family NADH-FMN oxidoreductase RutF
MFFDLPNLPLKDRYKLVSATIVPRPIAWVVSMDAEGRVNAAPFSFFNVFSADPVVVGFGVEPRHSGMPKDTAANIQATGQFTVCLVSEATAQAMNVTGAEVEPGVDEIALAGLTTAPSARVRPPRIAESPVALECETFQIVPIGSRLLILGQAVAMHVHDHCVKDAERAYIDTPALALVGRMEPPSWYIHATDRFEMPRVTAAEIAGRKG